MPLFQRPERIAFAHEGDRLEQHCRLLGETQPEKCHPFSRHYDYSPQRTWFFSGGRMLFPPALQLRTVTRRDLFKRLLVLVTITAILAIALLKISLHPLGLRSTNNKLGSPFTGAFARFPSVSSLPTEKRRITLVGVWNDDSFPSYFRHFFYTAQKNADSLDVLVINRIITPGKPCLNFAKNGVDITWGNNIKFICLEDHEYKKYYVDFMCSKEYGWNCDAAEYAAVTQGFAQRRDGRNYEWRPFLGFAVRSLFEHPENPFWGWIDFDNFLGDFRRYPFNILSQVSLLTNQLTDSAPQTMHMGGQLTGFNFEDADAGRAWKKSIGLRSPSDFVNAPDGAYPDSAEELYWSEQYLRTSPDMPGHDLAYVIYPGLHGDDLFDGEWGKYGATQMSVLSGRTVLVVDKRFTRHEIEALIELDRAQPIDEGGSLGWTGGEDGSAHMLANADIQRDQAIQLATHNSTSNLHRGIVDVQRIETHCTDRADQPYLHTCAKAHLLAKSYPMIYRTSLVRFKGQEPMRVFRRLELNDNLRGFERKLIRHHMHSKHRIKQFFDFPPFDITDDMVLVSNMDFVKVWKMGASREDTLYQRGEHGRSIG